MRDFTATDLSSTGNVFSLTDVAKQLAADDSDDTLRDGDKLTIQKLELRGLITCADTSNLCRLIVFKWRASDTTVPTKGDIIDGADATSLDTLRRYNEDTKAQYTVLTDRLYRLDTNGKRTAVFKWRFVGKKLGSPKITYTTDDGTEGVGKYYLLVVSDSGAASHPHMLCNSRAEFYDF